MLLIAAYINHVIYVICKDTSETLLEELPNDFIFVSDSDISLTNGLVIVKFSFTSFEFISISIKIFKAELGMIKFNYFPTED